MHPTLKKTIGVAVSVMLLLLVYYGSFLPLRKSVLYIDAIHQVRSIKSYRDFLAVFSAALDAPAPYGQAELVRNMGNIILGIIRDNTKDRPEVAAGMLQFYGAYYLPILERGRGMSYTQDVYLWGAENEMAFAKTGDPKYLAAAKSYYIQGLRLSPDRPQFLYGLLNVYLAEDNKDNARAMAERILSLWPADAKTGETLDKLSVPSIPR